MIVNPDLIGTKTVSLGIGLTNRCNLNCPHCYSRSMEQHDLTLTDIKTILKMFPFLQKVNFGTGESVLNKDFIKIMNVFRKRKVQMALTTNGLTINQLDDAHLRWLKDVDFSIDFPDPKLHDEWRGQSGLFNIAVQGIERCKKIGVDVSIALCLMNNNYKYLPEFKEMIKSYDIFLRINLYKPVDSKKFLLSYKEFWEAMKILSENFELVNNSEPILSIITEDKIKGFPCGDSLRIHPTMVPSACVYVDGRDVSIDRFRRFKKTTPKFCQTCQFVDSCHGGCLGRRYLTSGVRNTDIYCPFVNGNSVPKIKFKRTETKEFIHSSYLCTIIVK